MERLPSTSIAMWLEDISSSTIPTFSFLCMLLYRAHFSGLQTWSQGACNVKPSQCLERSEEFSVRELRKFMKTVNKVCDACLLATLPCLDFLSACDFIRPFESRPLLLVTNSSSTFLGCHTLPTTTKRPKRLRKTINLFIFRPRVL